MKKLTAWLKASRIPAQFFIFPSLLFGQVLYFSIYRTIDPANAVLIHLYGLFMHLFIVFSNDYADYETDMLNSTFNTFTGGSRVLVEGALRSVDLKAASYVMYILSVLTGALISLVSGSWMVIVLVVFGLKLLWAYSFSPIKLSYRGFGEILQVIGVGLVLPLIGFLGQGGMILEIPWYLLTVLLPMQLAMAVSTSMPDRPSDLISMKRTTVVMLGSGKAKYLVIALNISALFCVYTLRDSFTARSSLPLHFLPIYVTAFLQFFLALFSSLEPGSKKLFVFVLFSILINVSSILMVSYLLVIG